jgi:hypothetical protein
MNNADDNSSPTFSFAFENDLEMRDFPPLGLVIGPELLSKSFNPFIHKMISSVNFFVAVGEKLKYFSLIFETYYYIVKFIYYRGVDMAALSFAGIFFKAQFILFK